MKKTLFMVIFLLTICLNISSQDKTSLNGFWGIDWKTNKDKVKTALIAKGCTIGSEGPSAFVASGTFTGDAVNILFMFYQDQFYCAMVVYSHETNRAIQKYESIVSMLTEKYGTPTEKAKRFIDPYYSGDGYEEQAISVNKAVIFSTWVFSDNNRIACSIGDDLATAIVYTQDELDQLNTKAENEKSKNDL